MTTATTTATRPAHQTAGARGNTLKDFAHRLHGWGANVSVIQPGTKQPIGKWKHWQTQRQTADDLERLFHRHTPSAVGVFNGPGGWRVFDIDAPKDGSGLPLYRVPASVLTTALKAIGLPADYQWSYSSGSGAGWGFVIRCDEALPAEWGESGQLIGEPLDGLEYGHLELRWSSGQTVISGEHPTGPGYRWRRLEKPFVPPAIVPVERVVDAFLAIAKPPSKAAPASKVTPAPSAVGEVPEPLPVIGAADVSPRRLAAHSAALLDRVRKAPNGEKHYTLRDVATTFGGYVAGGYYDYAQVEQWLQGAIETRRGDVADMGAAYDTIEDGLNYGMLTPLYYDEPTHAHGAALRTNGNGAVVGDNGHGHNLQDAPAGDDAVPVAVAEAKLEALHVTEYRPEDGGILDAWLDVYGPSALWATGFDEWLIWNGRYWERDCELIIEGQIISILDAFNQQARDLARDARDKLAKAESAESKAKARGEVEMAGAFVTATKRTKARVASVEGMARAMRTVLGDKLDSNALLNLRNCTLELGTFQTHPHSPADLLTYCTDYDYDQTAVAVNWMRALERQPEAVRQFLQEFAGLSLTPDCKHELALWFVGAPGTGKSTAVHGFQVMLGAKAGQLSLADVEKGRFALADLPGKTLVTATEQPSDYITTAHTLNAIISGEPLRVEQKYRNATTITSRAKMLWAMNDLPRVKDANSGLFRRVKIVEWPAIPADEVDKDLRKAISVEGAGILNWALEGLRRLQARNSFIIPDEVVTATERFKHQSDIAGNFRDECLRVGDGLEVKSGELYMAYKEWTLANGTKPKSSVSVADEWRRLGFERSERRMDGYYWMGCELNGNGRKHLERGELR